MASVSEAASWTHVENAEKQAAVDVAVPKHGPWIDLALAVTFVDYVVPCRQYGLVM